MTDYKNSSILLDSQQRFQLDDPKFEHRVYNTGDQIWLLGEQVVALRTHDGIEWDISKPSLWILTP